MPIYVYRCASCEFEHEYLQKMSDARLTVCPECKKETFVKQVTSAGFQLKGSGWYATDFKGSGGKPEKINKSADEASTAKSEKKTDESKPASEPKPSSETKPSPSPQK